jgi:hypothetical protein
MATNKRIKLRSEEEAFTGLVQDKKASKLEERYARALTKLKIPFFFQYKINTPYTIPGRANSIDFVTVYRGAQAEEIDGEIGHKTVIQKSHDRARDVLLSQVLPNYGINPEIRRIEGWRVSTQEKADLLARRLH